MALIGAFVFLGDADSFHAYNYKALEYIRKGKYPKHKSDQSDVAPRHTFLYGPGPSPNVIHPLRHLTDGAYYEHVCETLAKLLNEAAATKTPGDKQQIFKTVIGLRALESLVRRMDDKHDVIVKSEKMRIQTTVIQLRLTNTLEHTATGEGGEVVFQNDQLTLAKLNYTEYKLTKNDSDEFKITFNREVTADTTEHTIAMKTFCTFNLNAYMVITHGNGHWRLVARNTVVAHASRLAAMIHKGRRENMTNLCSALTDYKWLAVMAAITTNPRMSDKDIFTTMFSARKPKYTPSLKASMNAESVINGGH